MISPVYVNTSNIFLYKTFSMQKYVRRVASFTLLFPLTEDTWIFISASAFNTLYHIILGQWHEKKYPS